MKNNIKFIYFDLGGVMLNWRNGFKKFAKEHNKEYEQFIERHHLHGQKAGRGTIDTNEFWNSICSDLNIVHSKNIEDWADHITNYFTPIKETHELARELVKKYSIGILSNTEFRIVENEIKKGLIPQLNYSVIIQSCDVGYAKPDMEIFHLAQQQANVKPEEILYIDDIEKYIRKAETLGWNGFVFDENNPKSSVEEIKDRFQL